ncbi:unnamed protein product [Larinioides sclopetarius]|uniref:Uncharacterized protein n=1 Tax=Larinioides sclopetarius TaxID=280406 RepID=A0AAV2AHD6_9ARAC
MCYIHCLYFICEIFISLYLYFFQRTLELEVYWIQHFLILITPFYLLRTGVGGIYTVEPLADMSWAMLTHGVVFLYHFLVLQGLGMVARFFFTGRIFRVSGRSSRI